MDKNHSQSVLLPAVSTGAELLDGDFFWEAHWKKVAAGLVAVVIAILAAGAWAYHRASLAAESAALYASASDPQAWREVASDFPGSMSAGNAQLRIASALRSEGKLDEALAELQQFTTAQPEHPLAGVAWLASGEIRQLQKNTPAALEAYRMASGRYQQSYAAPFALLAESRLLAAEGKAGESRAVLESIGTSYPDGPVAMVAAAELAATSRRDGEIRQAPSSNPAVP